MQRIICLAVLIGLSQPGLSANKEKDSANLRAMRKMQTALSEITAERDALKTETAKKTGELDALKKQIDEEKKVTVALTGKHEKETAAIQKTSQELRNRYEEITAKLRDVIEKYNALSQSNQALIGDHAKLNSLQKSTDSELKICAGKNRKMLSVSEEVIENYRKCQDRGWMDAVVDAEPLLQINTVKFEKMLQETEDRIKREVYESKSD